MRAKRGEGRGNTREGLFLRKKGNFVSQGARDGAVVRVLGFKSRLQLHMWVEFVVGSLLCSERFFSGYSGFPLCSKTNISKFQFGQESGRRRTTLWMCYLQIFIYLFKVDEGPVITVIFFI